MDMFALNYNADATADDEEDDEASAHAELDVAHEAAGGVVHQLLEGGRRGRRRRWRRRVGHGNAEAEEVAEAPPLARARDALAIAEEPPSRRGSRAGKAEIKA